MEQVRTVAGVSYEESNPPGAAGPPLLLVHGAGGTRLHWPAELRALPGRRVLALDLPGHGASPPPGRRTIGGYAGSVLGLLDALGIGAAVIGGHSMGGAIAQTLALEAPARVAGLALVGTGARLRVTRAVLEATSDPVRFAAAAEGMVAWSFGAAASPALRRAFAEGFRAGVAEVVHGDFTACDAFDVIPRLGAIRAPALVVCGTEDRLTPPKYAELLRDRIPGARHLLVPGAGHMVMQEAPAPVVAAVAALLDDVDRAGPPR